MSNINQLSTPTLEIQSEAQIIICEGYKTYKGFKYHLNFPNEWILYEEEDTGRQCANCIGTDGYNDGYACWRGIILGYCANCAWFYNGIRGRGFQGRAVEVIKENNIGDSAFDTYLKNIDLENTGNLLDSTEDTMENHEKMLAEISEICKQYDSLSEEYYQDEYEEQEIIDNYYNTQT
jgi:hypothetical protein